MVWWVTILGLVSDHPWVGGLQDNTTGRDEEENKVDDSWEKDDGDEEERRRMSERLASKPRRNFTRFNRFGFE